MGGRQRVRPYYGRYFKIEDFPDEIIARGLIIGSGYNKPGGSLGEKTLQVIAVFRSIHGHLEYVDPFDAADLEDSILRKEVVIEDEFSEKCGNNILPGYLDFISDTLENNFSSIELCSGITRLMKKNLMKNSVELEEPTGKEKRIMNASKVVARVKGDVIQSAKTAGKLEFVGRTGLTVIRQEAQQLLPMIPKEMLDNPMADFLLALLVEVGIAAVAPDNKMAATASQAMLTVALQNGAGKLRIPELASKLVSEIGVERIKSLMDEDSSK